LGDFLIIYADILFLVNFIMDCLCLYVSGKVLNMRISKLKLFCAGFAGGLYGLASACNELCEPFFGIAVSVLMTLICFNPKSMASFFKSLVLMYCVGMLFGGIMTFMQRIMYENRLLTVFSKGAGFVVFLVVAALMFVFVLLSSLIFRVYIHRKSADCIIEADDRSKKVRFLVDTGNMLRDPYTDKAVIIVKAQVLDGLLGENGIHRCFDATADNAVEEHMHFISAKTVSGTVLLPVIGSIKVYYLCRKGKKQELFASVAADVSGQNDYGGNDGVMPYLGYM